MALAAVTAAGGVAGSGRHTFGLYRLEIIAALANAVLLFLVGGYVLFEAATRLQDPPDVRSGPMLVVAIGGLVVNLVAYRLLRGGAAESLNLEGALMEVVADLAGSVGVIVAAVVMATTGWPYADPIVAAAIGLFILPRAWRLGRSALHVLTEAAPHDLDLESVEEALASVPDVVDVHDLHVWTLTSDVDMATAHLVIGNETNPHPVLDEARSRLRDDFGIAHATLQLEPDAHGACGEPIC
jgi:cobalt-zinc-cadmium efflux system protein